MASGRLHTRASDVGRLCSVNAMVAAWSLGAQTPSYMLMVVVFVTAFVLRDSIPAWRWPSRLAAISYPLYVVHGLSGYAIMVVVTRWGGRPFFAVAAAVVYSLVTATALHLLVEEPTRRLAGRIGRGVRDGREKPARNERTKTEKEANRAVPAVPVTGPLP
jgi:peptidoglycan/LPS O-acetylase OafA/YrhL